MAELQEIISGCIQQNRASQEKLYKLYYPALFLLCKKYFPENHQSLTVLNDGMMKVYRNISTFDPAKGTLFNWMYTIISNECFSAIRSAKLIPFMEFNDDVVVPAVANLWTDLEWKDRYQLLDILTPATRIVAAMFYLEGYSIKEIAEGTGSSQGTIKWHLSESRKKLKPVLEKMYSLKQ